MFAADYQRAKNKERRKNRQDKDKNNEYDNAWNALIMMNPKHAKIFQLAKEQHKSYMKSPLKKIIKEHDGGNSIKLYMVLNPIYDDDVSLTVLKKTEEMKKVDKVIEKVNIDEIKLIENQYIESIDNQKNQEEIENSINQDMEEKYQQYIKQMDEEKWDNFMSQCDKPYDYNISIIGIDKFSLLKKLWIKSSERHPTKTYFDEERSYQILNGYIGYFCDVPIFCDFSTDIINCFEFNKLNGDQAFEKIINELK